MALLPGIGTAASIIGTVTSIFGNPNDAKRKQQADGLLQRAINGDQAALVQLRCLSGDQSARAEAVRLGFLTQTEIANGTPCGYATKDAQNYAKNLLAEYETRRTVATVAAGVTGAAIQTGVSASAPLYTGAVVDHARAAGVIPDVPNWVLWAAGAALVVFLVRRR